MAEISDNELATLRGAFKLLQEISGSKHRKEFHKITRDLHPNEVGPTEDEIVYPALEEIKALRKELAEEKTARKGKELDDRLASEISQLKTDRDYTDDGIEKLKKHMIDNEIPNILVAANDYERRNPAKVQQPSTLTPSEWGFGRKTEDADIKSLFADEDAWADQEAAKAWNEAKQGQIIS